MNKKRKNQSVKSKKFKSAYELVNDILKVHKASPNYLSEIRQKFINFVIRYEGDKFPIVYKYLLDNEEFRNVSPIFNFDFNKTPNDFFFDEISMEKLLDLIIIPLQLHSSEIIEFENKRTEFESTLLSGDSAKAYQLLDSINSVHGDSIWAVRAEMLLLEQSNEHGALSDLIKKYKKKDSDINIFRALQTYISIFEAGDPKPILEKTINRDIREFIDGDALNLAGLNTLMYLPFPSQFDVHPFYSLKGLQQFNYIDLYILLKETLIRSDIVDKTVIGVDLEFQIKARVTEVISTIDPNWNIEIRSENKHLEWYESYNYQKIIHDLESNTLLESNLIINLNIYAKSYAYLNIEPSENLPTILRSCIENLINIYKLRDIQQSLSILNSLAINTICFDISKHVYIAIEKVLSYHSSKLNRLKVSFFSKYTFLGNTNASHNLVYAPLDVLGKNSLREKDKAKKSYLEKPSENSFSDYLTFKPIYKDIIEIKAAQLLAHENFDELLEFIVSELLKNELSYIAFPMEQVSSYINKNNIETENSVIFYYFYSLLLDKDSADSLHQVFDEFIIGKGIERPSEYFNSSTKISDKELFILSEVSKVEVMDYMGCFNSTSDLMYERISILNSLKEDRRTNTEKLEIEYQKNLNEILIQEATAKLITAKIFVDKQSIIKVNKGKINTLVNQFFLAKNIFLIDDFEQQSIKINNLLVDLYQIIMSEYLNNQEYGLDSNLSGEIRHTFFSNLLSSKPEDCRLLTEIGLDGKYKSNTYWLDEYKIVSSKITIDIDKRLKKFSQKFNELIDTTESWMKVSVDDSKPERVFVFRDPNSVFKSLMIRFLECTSPEELVGVIFESLDSQLNQCLISMRIKINDDFAIALDDLFEELLIDIERVKMTTSLTNLIVSIKSAKNSIKEDVKTASEWFNFRDDKTFSSYPLTEVIKISERCFRTNRSDEEKIIFINIEEIQIEGPYVPKLIMALNNFYANAKKHISDNEKIEIEIIKGSSEGYKIRIYNSISIQHRDNLLSGELERAKEKLKMMNSNSLLIEEGGTGLYKSKFKLITMSGKFDVKIELKDLKFITEVIFND